MPNPSSNAIPAAIPFPRPQGYGNSLLPFLGGCGLEFCDLELVLLQGRSGRISEKQKGAQQVNPPGASDPCTKRYQPAEPEEVQEPFNNQMLRRHSRRCKTCCAWKHHILILLG